MFEKHKHRLYLKNSSYGILKCPKIVLESPKTGLMHLSLVLHNAQIIFYLLYLLNQFFAP